MTDTPPPPPTAPVPPPGGSGMPPNPADYAPWGKRVLAYLIDYVPVAVLGLVALWMYNLSIDTMALTGSTDADGTNLQVQSSQFQAGFALGVPLAILALVVALLYWVWNRVVRMGTTGSSLGMGVVGTRAVKETTGEPLGVGVNLVRQILLSLDFAVCYVGALWPLWDSKHQTLISDKAVGAVVLPTK